MIDNDIKKALECLKGGQVRCTKCAYKVGGYPACRRYAAKDIDDLVNRQNAEIERLKRRIALWKEGLNFNPKEERAEAIKEFADRLKEKGFPDDYIGAGVVYVEDIDNLVEEMVGEHDV